MKAYRTHERFSLSEGRHLEATLRKAEGEYPVHWHQHFEIELILSGKGTCGINREKHAFPACSLFFLTPTDFHSFRTEGAVSLINISFDEAPLSGEELGALLSPRVARAYPLTEEERERLAAAARLLVYECETGGDCTRELLTYILRFLFRKNAKLPPIANAQEEDGIKRAYTYLELHFKERVTLRALAAEAGYHPSYFSELFRRVTGEGYADTLARLRVGYARSLLANGFSVTETCFASGFGSLSAFGVAFRHLVGVSPSAYARGIGGGTKTSSPRPSGGRKDS